MLLLYTTVSGRATLVGYCLLYIFSNPFTRPSHSLRLCQILILPPYQKQGHAARIFQVIYSQIMHTKPSVLLPASYGKEQEIEQQEIEQRGPSACTFSMYTVEDPCEDFTFVRDVFDCRLLRTLPAMASYLSQDPSGDVLPLTPETISTVQKEVGLIEQQLQKCYNILLYHVFNASSSRSYRLYVSSLLRGLFVDQTAASSEISK